jgi:hypothetical protein
VLGYFAARGHQETVQETADTFVGLFAVRNQTLPLPHLFSHPPHFHDAPHYLGLVGVPVEEQTVGHAFHLIISIFRIACLRLSSTFFSSYSTYAGTQKEEENKMVYSLGKGKYGGKRGGGQRGGTGTSTGGVANHAAPVQGGASDSTTDYHSASGYALKTVGTGDQQYNNVFNVQGGDSSSSNAIRGLNGQMAGGGGVRRRRRRPSSNAMRRPQFMLGQSGGTHMDNHPSSSKNIIIGGRTKSVKNKAKKGGFGFMSIVSQAITPFALLAMQQSYNPSYSKKSSKFKSSKFKFSKFKSSKYNPSKTLYGGRNNKTKKQRNKKNTHKYHHGSSGLGF